MSALLAILCLAAGALIGVVGLITWMCWAWDRP